MSISSPPRHPRAVAASSVESLVCGDRPETLGLDASGTLAGLVADRREADAAAARELVKVAHFAELHRVLDATVGAVDRSVHGDLAGEPLLGREAVLRVTGEGAYAVEEFAVAELAAALGLSEPAARRYVGQAVELRDRLPRCWARVMDGQLPAWKARQIAAETIRRPRGSGRPGRRTGAGCGSWRTSTAPARSPR